jgi:formylmethanofuran dehydrogenase subunit E
MTDLTPYIEMACREHSHLCPRQILGVRIGLAGMQAVGFSAPPQKKHLLVVCETDGCFVDGVSAPTGCRTGLRTLRVVDYGKIAAVFVNLQTGQALRVAPAPGVRQRAYAYAPGETRRYHAQMAAYQVMPVEELLSFQEVRLYPPVEELISRRGIRTSCVVCGEEIINEREILLAGRPHCRPCAGDSYYLVENAPIPFERVFEASTAWPTPAVRRERGE